MKQTILPFVLLLVAGCGGDSSDGGPLPSVSDKPGEAAAQQLKRFDDVKLTMTIFQDLAAKRTEIESPFLTPRVREKRKKEQEKSLKMWEPYDEEAKYEVKTEEKEGENVWVQVEKDYKDRTFTQDGSKFERKKRQYRVLMANENGRWVVLKKRDGCFMCKSTRECGSCKGTGKMGGDMKCMQCDGKKTCGQCKDGFGKEEDFEFKQELTLLEGRSWKSARSAPKETAESWAEVQVRMEHEQSVFFRTFMETGMKKFRGVWHSTVEDKMKKTIDEAVAKAKKTADPPKILSVEEKDGKATAIMEKKVTWHKGDGSKEVKTQQERLVMEKVGDEWLIDKFQRQCFQCEGKGSCGACKGTGKMSDQDCYSCGGKKNCRGCNGEKFTGD